MDDIGASPAAVAKAARPHVAIVMDGNGRWARARGLPRFAGHRAGALAARRVVEAAGNLGVGVLTLFAFSSDNWRRPAGEVRRVLGLIRRFLRVQSPRCAKEGVRLVVIGRRDRLPASLVRAIEAAEATTAACSDLLVRVAVDYSARDAIVAAAAQLAGGAYDRDAFGRELAAAAGGPRVPDVDLFLRPGGERRLSDFLLWESAYAELVFLDAMWPDVGPDELVAALAEFRARDRRFGSVGATAT